MRSAACSGTLGSRGATATRGAAAAGAAPLLLPLPCAHAQPVRQPAWAWVLLKHHNPAVSLWGAAAGRAVRRAGGVAAAAAPSPDASAPAASDAAGDEGGSDSAAGNGGWQRRSKQLERLRALQSKARRAATAGAAAVSTTAAVDRGLEGQEQQQQHQQQQQQEQQYSARDTTAAAFGPSRPRQQQQAQPSTSLTDQSSQAEGLAARWAGARLAAPRRPGRWDDSGQWVPQPQPWSRLGAALEGADRALTAQLGQAESWAAVEAALDQHPRPPNQHHVAAALSRLAALRRKGAAGPGGPPSPAVRGGPPPRQPPPPPLSDSQQALVDALVGRLAGAWHQLGRIQLCAVLVGMARLDTPPPPDDETAALAAVLAASSSMLRRQLVSCLWALARLEVTPQPGWVRSCLDGRRLLQPWALDLLDPGNTVALAWALGRWRGGGLDPSAEEAQLLLDTATADASGPRGLAIVGWAAVRVGLAQAAGPAAARAWADRWAAALAAAVPAANGHDAALALWTAAALASLDELAAGEASSDTGAVLSHWRPPGALLDALSQQAAAAAAVATPTTGGPPGRGRRDAADAGARASELAVSLWSLGRLGFRPAPRALRGIASALLAAAAEGDLAPQGYAMAVVSLSRLRALPAPGWLDALLAAGYEVLPLFTPREAAGLISGLSSLRHIPGEAWMAVWWWDTAAKLPLFGARELAASLRGTVRLGQAPPRPWLRAWHARSLELLQRGAFPGRYLGVSLPAFALLERAPSRQWMAAFWRATAVGTAAEGAPWEGEGLAAAGGSEEGGGDGGSGGGSAVDAAAQDSSDGEEEGEGSEGGGPLCLQGTPSMVGWDLMTARGIAWALARLQLVPPAPWSEAFLEVTRPLLADAPGPRLATLAWAVAALGAEPTREWMEALGQALSKTTLLDGGSGGLGEGAAPLRPVPLSRLLWALDRLDPLGEWVPLDKRSGIEL